MRTNKTLQIFVVIVLAMLSIAAAHKWNLDIETIIKQYPTVVIGNAARCEMNWDIKWRVYNPFGDVILETYNRDNALLTLVSCDQNSLLH